MSMKVYGIPNCTTVKKARAWLAGHAVPHEFVDFKRSPPSGAMLERWADALGWEQLLNRRGTTWRNLAPAEQAGVIDAATAIAVMRAHPSTIRRPVVEEGAEVLVGFDADAWAARFGRAGRRRGA